MPLPDSIDVTPLLPLKTVPFQILRVLVEQESHGYAMASQIQEQTAGLVRLEPGNLYRFIRKLSHDGLVERTERKPSSGEGDARRQYYSITPAGRAVFTAEVARLRSAVQDAERVLQARPAVPGGG